MMAKLEFHDDHMHILTSHIYFLLLCPLLPNLTCTHMLVVTAILEPTLDN